MVAIYETLPTSQKIEVPSSVIQESTRLFHEFLLYIVKTKALKKCFASVKGYYYQAVIRGETVTWLVPHKFSQELPMEVDFKVGNGFNLNIESL
jgi:pescadillo